MSRKNLIGKKYGIGDHMPCDEVTDIIFAKANKYIDIISQNIVDNTNRLGQCIKNQYVHIEWIKTLIATDAWKEVGKEKALYEYFVDDGDTNKPNMKNAEGDDDEVLYKRASGDMQFDFDDLPDEIIENIKNAFLEASKHNHSYNWFEYSWSHNYEHKLSGCHVRIFCKLGMKSKIEWGFYYIHYLNGLLKYVNDEYLEEVIKHIDWSCCSITRGFAIPYNKNGVVNGLSYDEDKIGIINTEKELDKAFNYVCHEWVDELYNMYYKKFITPKKRKELIKMGLIDDANEWKYRYTMEEDWNFDEKHPIVSGEDHDYNWRLSLVTTLMGVFNDKEIVKNICAVIYKYIEPYKNHTYEEMLYNELERKIFARANFSLEPSHLILKELWNDWGLKITIRPNIK